MRLIDKIILYLVVFLAFAILVHGQSVFDPSSTEILNLNNRENQVLIQHNNEVFLQQIGVGNQTVVVQHSQMNGANVASITQYGQLHQVFLNQYGTNNIADHRQEGSMNLIDVIEHGNLISSTTLQSGSNNRIYQELGTNRASYRIIQQGSDHEVIDLGFSTSNPGYTIKQTGLVGMKVVIKHH
ncbi:MAG: hypothetical protein ABJG78_08815 [Cyclobacteriaceae bacterium]